MRATPTPAPVSPAAVPVDALMAARTEARVVPVVPVLVPSHALDAQPPLPATCPAGAVVAPPRPATAALAVTTAATNRRPAAARRREADPGMGCSIPAAGVAAQDQR